MRRFWWCMVAWAVSIAPQAVAVAAAQDQATVGAQSGDKGKQALAFLPNEIWIHAPGSVTWTFPTDEIHTVTFLTPAQSRPIFQVGCPGTTPDNSFPGKTDANCVNSGTLLGGATYTVNFPSAGNFKLVCLVHTDMTGVIHVLNPSDTLPHDQSFYDHEAKRDRHDLLEDGARLEERGLETAARTSETEVTVGIGEIVATTGGGTHTVSVMRFLDRKMIVHVGETVEWTNLDPVTPHTVTFGAEPLGDPTPPSGDVTTDSDGSRHAALASPGGSTHSGFLVREPQERVGLPQQPPPPVVTRFRVTFNSPGTYNYFCALHDDLGMKGKVVVVP